MLIKLMIQRKYLPWIYYREFKKLRSPVLGTEELFYIVHCLFYRTVQKMLV